MKPLTTRTLLENIFLFAGGSLLLASMLFYILTDMMLNARTAVAGDALTVQLGLIRDSGTVFIFVPGAMFSLAGLVYAGVNAWRKFVSGKPAEEE